MSIRSVRHWIVLLRVLGLLGIAASTGAARTYVVRPDGSGDFPTIQGAVSAAVNGDVVVLGEGVFSGPGNRDIDVGARAITIRSESGDPSGCTIDCEGAGRGIHYQSAPSGSRLEGITITRGEAQNGGAVEVVFSLQGPVIENCVFYRNTATTTGGAVHAPGAPDLRGCRFVENSSGEVGGAFFAGGTSDANCRPTFDGCLFVGNIAVYGGGAMFLEAVPIREGTIRNCTFVANSGGQYGGAICLSGLSPTIENCTFAFNAAVYGTVDCLWTASPAVTRCILAFAAGGAAVTCTGTSAPVLACCDLFANPGGDWIACIADQLGVGGNFSADPGFCDPEHREFTLRIDSPCAEGGTIGCGLIGAWPVGCGPVPVRPMRWGMIKWVYR